jgi:hypothetical protein
VYHIRIIIQKEDDSGKVSDKFERETLVRDSEIDSLTFGLSSTDEFCTTHLHPLIWGMLVNERERREMGASGSSTPNSES